MRTIKVFPADKASASVEDGKVVFRIEDEAEVEDDGQSPGQPLNQPKAGDTNRPKSQSADVIQDPVRAEDKAEVKLEETSK